MLEVVPGNVFSLCVCRAEVALSTIVRASDSLFDDLVKPCYCLACSTMRYRYGIAFSVGVVRLECFPWLIRDSDGYCCHPILISNGCSLSPWC
jgi:hypothetical protein